MWNPLSILDGSKTYIAAFALIGLGCYLIASGDPVKGAATIAQGLAALGLRRAITTSS